MTAAGMSDAGPVAADRAVDRADAGSSWPAQALPPGLPCGAEGPVFAEPWQAHAFAIVLSLHERGLFTWPEWADHLSRAIRAAQRAGDPDNGDTYYQHWLDALEALLIDKGVAAPLALTALRQAWRLAAETTPHGQPIELARSARRRFGRE